MQVGRAIGLAKPVRKTRNDVVSQLVIGDMGGAASEIRVGVGECDYPVGKGNVVRLAFNDLVNKFVLPVTREPFGFELRHELVEGKGEECVVVGLNPSNNIVVFETIHDAADLILGGDTFGTKHAETSDAKAPDTLEADGPSSKQGVAVWASLRDNGIEGLVGRRHPNGVVGVVRVCERVGVRVFVNVLWANKRRGTHRGRCWRRGYAFQGRRRTQG